MADRKPTNKAEMMSLIDERWSEFQALVNALTPQAFEQRLGDGWSAKVHVGHVAAWERSLLALLRGEDRNAAMGVPPELAARHDLDEMNGLIARNTDGLPAGAARAYAASAHDEVTSLLESLSEAQLSLPYSHYQPTAVPPDPQPVYGWVNGNTWGHYEEHIGWLRAGLEAPRH
jgi:hypothetical protein